MSSPMKPCPESAPATITQAELDALPKGNDDKPAPATGNPAQEGFPNPWEPAPATGEWTTSKVSKLLDEGGWTGLTAAITAALAAEHREFVELEELYRDSCKDVYAITGKLDAAAEALEKAQHGLKIGVDPGIVRARIIDAMNEIKPANCDQPKRDLREQLDVFRENWPQVHKAIRSDIMLGEAAEEIHALAELAKQLSEHSQTEEKSGPFELRGSIPHTHSPEGDPRGVDPSK